MRSACQPPVRRSALARCRASSTSRRPAAGARERARRQREHDGERAARGVAGGGHPLPIDRGAASLNADRAASRRAGGDSDRRFGARPRLDFRAMNHGSLGVCSCGYIAIARCQGCGALLCETHAKEIPQVPDGLSENAQIKFAGAVRLMGGDACVNCRAERGRRAISEALSEPRAPLPEPLARPRDRARRPTRRAASRSATSTASCPSR